MFREMRRKRQQLSQERTEEILRSATSGVLALAGDDGYPYAVPLSHVYADGKIYFHSAVEGHKLDAISRCDKASFCVVERDDVVPEKFTTYFRSVIAFGRVRVVEDEASRVATLRLLAGRFAPGMREAAEREIAQGFARVCLLEFTVEHLTGKEAIELVGGKA